jgi:hypothetical protein
MASHADFSPKVSVNLRYVSAARHTGHLYATVARSFTAATHRHLRALHVGCT